MENLGNKTKMNANHKNIFRSHSYSTTNEDDGSVFTEENGATHNIRPGEYIRACGAFETIAAEVAKYKNFTTVVPVWLESKEQINPVDVLEALWIVSRQVPQLQFCLGKRSGKLWFKRMIKLDIDFETGSKDVMEVIHELFDTTFDLWNGPLWKVRLIFHKEKTESDKFSAVFIYVASHSINDGVTNMKIIREFVYTMNQLSAGHRVSPTFSPIIGTIDKIARNSVSNSFLIKEFSRKVVSTLIGNFRTETSFSGRIPSPKTKEAKTKILIDDFSKCETEMIAKMCKQEGISMNTFIITITNFALLTVAETRSKTPLGARDIVVAQNVNTRRHVDKKYSDATGYHVSLLEDKLRLSLADSDKFWEVASEHNDQLKESLEVDKGHLKIIPIYKWTKLYYLINSFLTRNGFKNKTCVHYVTSNMGNLKNFLPESKDEDNIEVTFLIRACSLQLTGAMFMLNFQTLNGKLILSLDYYTNQMKDEIAREFFSILCLYIRNMVNFKNLKCQINK